MVSHDTFKNVVLFALVIAFLYFLFREKIDTVVEEPFEMPKFTTPQHVVDNRSGVMTAANTGINRSLIKSDEEIGILSTCQQNSGGELIQNCEEIHAYNYDYDKSFDQFLRPTSFDQPNFLKSTGL